MSVATGPTTHARLAPSSSSRWLPCPHSAIPNPPDTGGEAARIGTVAHDWAAKVLLGECPLSDVPPQFRHGIKLYVDKVRENEVQPLVERRWESIEIPEFFGTVDCLLIHDGQCAVFDFKHGRWPVKAEGNKQLLCYAALAAEHFMVDTFTGVIVQPNSKNGETVQVAEFLADEVEEHREAVREAAVADYKKTGEHCRFCPVRMMGQCEEGKRYARRRGWKK